MTETACLERLKEKATAAGLSLRPRVSIEEVSLFELESGVRLPEDYVYFLTQVGNGGTVPCRLLGIRHWGSGYWTAVDPRSVLKQPCLITPGVEHHGERWMEAIGGPDATERFENDTWEPLAGAIAVAVIGCGLFWFMNVNGAHKGRLFSWGDVAASPPQFAPELNYADWLEAMLDLLISGKPVHLLDGRIK